ncbi:MAG: hypothetical protein A2W03_04165 [Candidatus Aminicenantes bacterium RBG_16_63_16]|nr:MAG: hypothetical protein A2W03_04165 [Candidatus Aminicenantes bacterium RBG_16_63_16]
MPANTTREIRIILPEELFDFLVPRETHEHLSRAKKEVLLALRSIIDARIEMLEKREARKDSPKKKIKVE